MQSHKDRRLLAPRNPLYQDNEVKMRQFHIPCKTAAEVTSPSPIRGFASKDTVTDYELSQQWF